METDTDKYYRELANLTSRIWFEDDKRKYNDLEKIAKKLLFIRGIEKTKAIKIANLIRKSYERYGLLDDRKINDTIQNVFDNFILSNFNEAYNLLNENNPKKQAKHHELWWKNFYIKKQFGPKRFLKLFYHIFLYNKNKIKKIGSSLSCTILLIQAGMRHNKRDFSGTESKLIDYWKKLDGLDKTHIVF